MTLQHCCTVLKEDSQRYYLDPAGDPRQHSEYASERGSVHTFPGHLHSVLDILGRDTELLECVSEPGLN